MSKLKKKIRNDLRKNPDALGESLMAQAADSEALNSSIAVAVQLNTQVQSLADDRKKLSRQIGAARAAQKDPSDLIANVSEISEKIKALDANVDLEVDRIMLLIKSADVDSNSEQVQRAPAHMASIEEKLDCDASKLKLSHGDNVDVQEWQRFVASQANSNIYHDAKWCSLIRENFGHQGHYITCRKPDGELCGVFPTIHLQSKLFGSFLVSMPYFNYGGPLSSYPAVVSRMMEYAAEIGSTLDCTHLETRDTQPIESWYCKQHKVTMILPLPDSDEELDQQLGSKVRAQVNRAAREELEYTVGGVELLPEFYKVFSHNMRDLGTPVYSKRFFASILNGFDQQSSLAVVRHNGKPVAAGFLLGYKDKLEIPWASSLRKANPLGANMFMYRQILRTAIEQKYQFFDFGRSSKDASTYKYKKQWGAIEHPLYWHYWLRDSDELPELNPNNPKYKLAISMWQKLPVSVANIIGPQLVRNLP